MMRCGDTCGAIVVKMPVLMLMQTEAKGGEQYNQGKKRCKPFLHDEKCYTASKGLSSTFFL